MEGGEALLVFASDVIWTAELAHAGKVLDLTSSYSGTFDARDFLEAARNSASYRLRVWGVPWYTDVSLLSYRKDLLTKSGFDAPPRTWAELATTAKKVMDDSAVQHGFVFQAADYEGGAANALELVPLGGYPGNSGIFFPALSGLWRDRGHRGAGRDCGSLCGCRGSF